MKFQAVTGLIPAHEMVKERKNDAVPFYGTNRTQSL
jgi:hypothetical protein